VYAGTTGSGGKVRGGGSYKACRALVLDLITRYRDSIAGFLPASPDNASAVSFVCQYVSCVCESVSCVCQYVSFMCWYVFWHKRTRALTNTIRLRAFYPRLPTMRQRSLLCVLICLFCVWICLLCVLICLLLSVCISVLCVNMSVCEGVSCVC